MKPVKFNAKQIDALAAAMWNERILKADYNPNDREHKLMADQHYMCCYSLAETLRLTLDQRPAFYAKCGAIC